MQRVSLAANELPVASTVFLRACNAFAGCWMASNVTLRYRGLTESRLHILTIKETFTGKK